MYNQKMPFVYELSYPEEMPELAGIVFYVGKGTKASRIDSHSQEASSGCPCEKCAAIRSIWDLGLVVVRRIVFEHPIEEEALKEEKRRMILHDSPYLTNKIVPREIRRKPSPQENIVIPPAQLIEEEIDDEEESANEEGGWSFENMNSLRWEVENPHVKLLDEFEDFLRQEAKIKDEMWTKSELELFWQQLPKKKRPNKSEFDFNFHLELFFYPDKIHSNRIERELNESANIFFSGHPHSPKEPPLT